MAGGWASALGAAILQGNRSYQGAVETNRAQAQQEFENRRQMDADKRAQEEHTAQLKLQALQAAITQDKVTELPKEHAKGDVDSLLKLLGPEAAFNNPGFVDSAKAAGFPITTKDIPLVLNDQGRSEFASQQGIAPETGAVLPPDIVQAQLARQHQTEGRNALLKSGGPAAQAIAYHDVTGQAMPNSVAGNWEVRQLTDPMTGTQHLVRVNPQTGVVQSLAGGSTQGVPSGQSVGGAEVHGDEFLKKVSDPKVATAIKMLANYEGVLPSGSAMRTPYWSNILAMTKQFDPTFDATNYPMRQAVKKDFTSGKTATNIKALNTATKHISQLDDAMKGLGNFNFEPANAVINPVKSAFGVGNVKGAKLDATAVMNELANVFKQTGATDEEIAQFKDSFSINNGPNNQANVIKEAVKLMQGRLDAVNNQWTTAMGVPPSFKILQPDAQNVFNHYAPQTLSVPNVGPDQPNVGSGGLTYQDYLRAQAAKQGPK